MAALRKIATLASALSCVISPAAATFPSYAASLGNTSVPANSSSFSACDFVPGAPIKTTSGTVRGRRANNATAVSEYLGIPFAQPPVGDLRFAPPARYTSNRMIDGTKFGNICAQSITDVPFFLPSNVYNLLADLAGIGQTPQEDCLTINVWTKPQSGSKRKPVMLWIYGGGFQLGGTNTSSYSGQYWADTEDVVFVNFNYRLGIFGFSGSPAGTQNVALLDQRMAVEWVRDNIAAFGGDPNRITIFGESAGAASVDYYNYAWTQDPIIAGSIAQSGEANAFGNRPAPDAAENWYNVTQTLGCGSNETSSAEDVLSCMRSPKITQEALINATRTGGGLTSVLGNFGPTIDNKLVFSNYTELGINGRFIQKPAIVGNNDYEAGLFILITAGTGQTFPQSFWDGFTQNIFTCPSNTAAYFRELNDVPVYRYRYFPAFPNNNIPTSTNRAYHSSEILVLFGTSQDITKQDSTQIERSLGNYMRSAWATFAHCPTSVENVYEWPRYSQMVNGTRALIALGRDNSTGAEFVPRGMYDGDCALISNGAIST